MFDYRIPCKIVSSLQKLGISSDTASGKNYGISALGLKLRCFYLAVNKELTLKMLNIFCLITENSGFLKYTINKLEWTISIIDIILS